MTSSPTKLANICGHLWILKVWKSTDYSNNNIKEKSRLLYQSMHLIALAWYV